MITVLKVPLYVSIETDNIERAKVTKLLQQAIIPEIIRNLVSVGNKYLKLSPQEYQLLTEEIGSFSLKLMTDLEAMARKEF